MNVFQIIVAVICFSVFSARFLRSVTRTQIVVKTAVALNTWAFVHQKEG